MRTGIGPQNLGLPGGKPGHTPCGCRKPEVSVLEVEVSPLNKNGKASGTSGGDPAFRLMHDAVKENDKLQNQTPTNKIVDVDGTEVDTDKPGMSNAGKYKDVPADDFAGPHGTYPINTEARGKSAIKLAHNAANPEAIKAKVYKKYPELKPEIGVQSPSNNSKTA